MPPYVRQDKLDLIDHSLRRGVETFADLGGAWGVEGYYTYYTLTHGHIHGAFLVDLYHPPGVQALEREHDVLEFVHGDFTLPETLARFPKVDAIYLFDVLLHQAAPDWDEVLRRVEKKADRLVIFNPNWVGDRSIRLTELPEDEYCKVTPHYKGDPLSAPTYENPGASSRTGRPNRDSLAPFQWGITDDDLRAVMDFLGFSEVHYSNGGQWLDYPSFRSSGFIFERSKS